MSYVAITKALKNDIQNNLNAMRDAEQRGETAAPEAPTLTGMEPRLAPALWGVLYGTPFERHPDLTNPQKYSVKFTVDGEHDFSLVSLGVPLHFMVHPSGDRYMRLGPIKVESSVHTYFAAIVAYQTTAAEIVARWNRIYEQIVTFVDACASLNDAVKKWPDLRRYVPEETLAKMDVKSEKPQKRDQSEAMKRLAAMDLESITTSTVLARLGSTGQQGTGS